MALCAQDLQYAHRVVRSKYKFRPGQPRQYLYIAKEIGGPEGEYKLGKTTRPPEQRMRSMGGQSSVEFELVAAYEVINCTEAEGWAFLNIDLLKLRKHPGTRIELVLASLPVLQEICARAAETSIRDSLERLQQQELVVQALGLQVKKDGQSLQAPSASRRFWLDAFAWCVKMQGQLISLGTLLTRALTDEAARRRLAKLGMTCCAVSDQQIAFQMDWLRAPALLQHQCLMGHDNREAFKDVVAFKIV